MTTKTEIEIAEQQVLALWLEDMRLDTPVTAARLADAKARLAFLEDERSKEGEWLELL